MDPDIMVKDSEKIVYAVHIEKGAMVQVAGGTGRIVLQESVVFWQISHRVSISESFGVFGLAQDIQGV